MTDWRKDPRWVDFGDLPVGSTPRSRPLERCAECGRSGELYPDGAWVVVVHGGIFYDKPIGGPYVDDGSWRTWFAMREEHRYVA
jgi:hypothetical protein